MDLINNIPNVPGAVGPYSQAVKHDGLLFCSGQIPINPAAGKIEATDVEGQARQMYANISVLLASQGLAMFDVIKSTLFLQSNRTFLQPPLLGMTSPDSGFAAIQLTNSVRSASDQTSAAYFKKIGVSATVRTGLVYGIAVDCTSSRGRGFSDG